jgi:hypothetical protein
MATGKGIFHRVRPTTFEAFHYSEHILEPLLTVAKVIINGI